MSANPPLDARGASAAYGAVPARLGRYEVLRRMAVGGMAEIYLARTTGPEGFEKPVVIKRIHPRLAASREIVSMFLDEARIAATLRHSNIVQVYDIGEADGEYFFAMELLHGEDAGSLMEALGQRERKLPLEHAVGIVANVCAGLHYAHERLGRDGASLGIIHRDVSPSNAFVTTDGEVKLLDFGVAKAAHRLSVTTGGFPKGKLAYMSPEQLAGLPLDRRSDIFSLAVLLWELSTSRRLRRARSDYETMKAITDEDAPPPSVFQDDYPADLERIVVKGLARDREQRYQTAQELQLALEEFSREHKLPVSSIALGALMKELFGVRRTAWLDTAKATTEGEATAPPTPAIAFDRVAMARTDPEQHRVTAPPPEPSATAATEVSATPPAPPAVELQERTAPGAAPDTAQLAMASTQQLPQLTAAPPTRGRAAATSPTLEIPAVTQQQLATAQRAAVAAAPSATAAGELKAAPRKLTSELPPVAPAAAVVAPPAPTAAVVAPPAPAAAVVAPPAPLPVTPPAPARRVRLGLKVGIGVVAALLLGAILLLAARVALFGAPVTPPHAASKAPAARPAVRTPPARPSAKGAPGRAAPPHGPAATPPAGSHAHEGGHR